MAQQIVGAERSQRACHYFFVNEYGYPGELRATRNRTRIASRRCVCLRLDHEEAASELLENQRRGG